MPSRKKRKRDRRQAEATAQAPKTQGGLPTSRGDLVLLQQAINEDWPVPRNVRGAIATELSDEIDSPDVRRFLAVTKVFLVLKEF